MAQAAGGNARIIVGVEGTYGTQPNSMFANIIPFVSETLQSKRASIRSNVITGARNLKAPRRGNTDVSGTITTELSPVLGTWFRHLLGTVATTGTSPYVHTFKVGSLPVGLCIEKGFTDLGQYLLYNGCRISKASFECAPGAIAGFSMDIMGAKETVGATSKQSSAGDRGHIPFDAYEAVILEGGSSLGSVKSIKFDVDNDLDANIFTIGSGNTRKSLPEGLTIVTGTMLCQFDDIALYNKAVNGTESSVRLTFTHGTGSGDAGNELLEIYIPELFYEQRAPVVSGPRGVDVEMPFQAFYENDAAATSIQMMLRSSVASFF